MQLTTANVNANTINAKNFNVNSYNIDDGVVLGNVSIYPTDSLSIGSSIITSNSVSVPALVLGGINLTGQYGGIIDYQEFTANGIWYNPYYNSVINATMTGSEQVLVMAWGGGGGGGGVVGGGGGACFVGSFPVNSLSNTCAVTVGLGGATGVAGGNTSFVINSTSTVVAYGGANGVGANAGGGGGTFGTGVGANGGGPLGQIGNNSATPIPSTYGGGGGAITAATAVGGSTIFGGGGGGGNTAGSSIYGGGGGSGFIATGTSTRGGSVFGGRGANTSTAAAAPGGGGTPNTAFSSGARGEVRAWTFGSIIAGNVIPPTIGSSYVYNGLYITTQTSADASATVNVGTPDASRLLVLGLAAYTYYDGYPVTVAVNGVQANAVAISYYSPGYNYHYLNMIYSIPLPTGTTANVVVTSVGGGFYSGENFAIASYSLYNLQSQTPRQILPTTFGGYLSSNTATFTSTTNGDIVIAVSQVAAGTTWIGDMAPAGGANSWYVSGTGWTYPQTGAILQLANNKSTISYSVSNAVGFDSDSAHATWR